MVMNYMIIVLSLVLNLEPPHVVVNIKGPQMREPVGVEIQPLFHLPNFMF